MADKGMGGEVYREHVYIPSERASNQVVNTLCDECGALLFARRGNAVTTDVPHKTVLGRFLCESHEPERQCDRCGCYHAIVVDGLVYGVPISGFGTAALRGRR